MRILSNMGNTAVSDWLLLLLLTITPIPCPQIKSYLLYPILIFITD